MFLSTYKSTLKTLFRSPLFWFMTMLIFFMVLKRPFSSFSNVFSYTLNETFGTNDPRIIIDYKLLIKQAANSAVFFMDYAFPIFTVTSVVLILNRDYGDNFYEIEKAAGIKPGMYLFGRLSALITVNFLYILICAMVSFYLFFIIHADGGVEWGRIESMSMGLFLSESIPRVLRNIVYIAWPCTLMYISLTYCVGSIFKNGISAALTSLAYVLFARIFVIYGMRTDEGIAEFYKQYLQPVPLKLLNYFYWFDTPEHERIINAVKVKTSLEKALICISIFLVCSIVYITVSYIRTRRRDR